MVSERPVIKSLRELDFEQDVFFNCIVTFSGILKDNQKPFCKVTGIKDYDSETELPSIALGYTGNVGALTIYPPRILDLSTELILEGRKVAGNGLGPEFEYRNLQLVARRFDHTKKMLSDINPILRYGTQTGAI